MHNSDKVNDATRRSIIKAVGGALGVGAAGVAATHPEEGTGGPNEGHDHTDPSIHESVGDIDQVGYHSLGGMGQSDPENPHYGGLTECRVQDGYAFVGFISSRGPTPNRGFAILDVSEFTEARNDGLQLEFADIDLLGIARDDNDASAVMDIKVTDDGQYAAVSREPVSTLFGEPNKNKDAEGSGTSAGANSLQLWDVSDKSSPRLTSEDHTWGLGPHNAYCHNIRGDDYVFAVGVTSVSGNQTPVLGLHVFRINRTTDQLEFVNKYDRSGQVRHGGGFTGAGDGHDVTVLDDPKTGRPYVYFGMWSLPGMQVLDASDPTDLQEIGVFPMARSHYVQPAPTLVDGKRVAIAGQETIGVNEGSSGRLYLVDCDGLDESGETNPEIGRGVQKADADNPAEYLDFWEWQNPITFGEEFSYYLGPHNADITQEGWIHLGHYHGGVMYFEIATEEIASEDPDIDQFDLIERGSFKPTEPVPEESKMGDPPGFVPLGKFSPFCWCAVEANGLTFISDINQGVFIAHHHDLEVGSDARVNVDAGHRDDGRVFTAGQTDRIDLEADVQVLDGDGVWIRTRVPSEWTVYDSGSPDIRSRDIGFETLVEFETAIGAGADDGGTRTDGQGTRTMFVGAPQSTGAYTFGPIEYTTDPPSAGDGNRVWQKLVTETMTNTVVGVDTSSL
jgi:hypothetical protein